MAEFHATESHVSWLVFTPDRVYKVKKPVQFGFVDFRDRAARVQACRSEVRLNSRLSPDVYLGVGLFEDPAGFTEPVVVMKRLPSDASLAALVARDDNHVGSRLTAVAGALAEFHNRAERSPIVDAACTASAVGELWMRNLGELRQVNDGFIAADQIDAVELAAERYLAGRAVLFDERIADGSAVDGHGDLLADDIFCLDDGPRILDCLEFDDALRRIDVAQDVASLSMDLERLGRPDLAGLFRDAYGRESPQIWPDSLAHHYVAYRASVRSKVACITRSRDLARRLVDLSASHLGDGAVRLVVIAGLPGTGKTTLAVKLSEVTGWPALHTDVLRKQIAGMPGDRPAGSAFATGIYRPEMMADVYAEMLRQAERLLVRGQSVILDGSWQSLPWRQEAERLAARTYSDLTPVTCETGREVANSRLQQRATVGGDSSDATVVIRNRMETDWQPWPPAMVLDTADPAGDVLGAVLGAVRYGPRPVHPSP